MTICTEQYNLDSAIFLLRKFVQTDFNDFYKRISPFLYFNRRHSIIRL